MNPVTTSRAQLLQGAIIITILSSVIFVPSIVYAASDYWVCGSGMWDSLCWSSTPGGAPIYTQPLNADYVYLTQSDAVNRTVTYSYTAYVLNSVQIDATGTGSMTLSQDLYADQLNSINETIGVNGSGTHTQSVGTNIVQNYLILGQNAGSNGSYFLSGSGSLTANNVAVGLHGNGTFTQTSGSHQSNLLTIATEATGAYDQSGGTNVTTTLYIGNASGSSGSYNLSSTGSLTVGFNSIYGNEFIGWFGTGNFTQTGGTHTVNGSLDVGDNAGGTYNQSGGTLTAGRLSIGVYAGSTGMYAQSGGTVTAGSVVIGGNGATGSYSLSENAQLTASGEFIGYAGTGTFSQTGGANAVNSNLYFNGSSGTYNLNAGTLSVGGNITTSTSDSTLNIGNGALTVGGGNGSINVGNFVLGSIAGSNVNYTLTSTGLYQGFSKVAGTLTAGNITVGRDGAGTFTQNGTNVTTGAVTLAANAGGSGTYTLNSGTLNAAKITVNSSGNFNFNGGRLVVGTFTGNLVNNGGTLALGDTTIGSTNIVGNYNQSDTGAFAVKLGGTGAGQFDTLNVSGIATLDGTLNINLFDLGSGLYSPQYGDTIDILTAAGLSGQFSSLNYAPLGNGLVWDVSYVSSGTTDIVALTAVPIPTTVWLFGSGLLGLLGIAKRRKQ